MYISAEHNLGMIDLYDVLAGVIEDFNKKTELPESESIRLRIAIIGRPNVGKSTFLNSLLAENRLIVSSKPRNTRDSVDISYDHNGKLITLIDTAGICRKANVVDNLESRFVEKSIESIKRSHVVILMLDSLLGVEQQDLSIAEAAIKGGKGIIIVLNKWDLIGKDDRSKLIKFVKQQEVTRLFLEVPTVTISALKGMRCGDVIDKCLEVSESLNKKISTAKLNNWLIGAVEKHSHPLIKGRAIKMKYIAQIGTKPPAFSLVCNVPESVDESYKRYLTNGLTKKFLCSRLISQITFEKEQKSLCKVDNLVLLII